MANDYHDELGTCRNWCWLLSIAAGIFLASVVEGAFGWGIFLSLIVGAVFAVGLAFLATAFICEGSLLKMGASPELPSGSPTPAVGNPGSASYAASVGAKLDTEPSAAAETTTPSAIAAAVEKTPETVTPSEMAEAVDTAGAEAPMDEAAETPGHAAEDPGTGASDDNTAAEAPGSAPAAAPEVGDSTEAAVDADAVANAEEAAPELFDVAPADADNLKEIKGVGPGLETTLNEMGIYKFAQIATWGASEIAWVDARLKFKGRIVRDNWVDQAKTLAGGGSTDFSKKVESGGVYES
ncbi:MAG: hypothetical protein AAF631_04660 [Pseudomonadota bacterium]